MPHSKCSVPCPQIKDFVLWLNSAEHVKLLMRPGNSAEAPAHSTGEIDAWCGCCAGGESLPGPQAEAGGSLTSSAAADFRNLGLE